MDKMSNSGTLPWDQAFALRSLRDCGMIRARGNAAAPFTVLCHKGLAVAKMSPNMFYADFRLTEAGRGIAG